MFIRAYRLEKDSVMLVFSTQLCELLPLFPSLWFAPPLPCVNKYTLYSIHVYTIQCVKGGGGMGFLASDRLITCRKIPLQVNFFR
jgi:hypothetical protein